MKSIFTILLLLTVCMPLSAQEMPDWVRERPVSSVYYIGIGRALKTDRDYMQTAKQNALKDLASELKVQVSSNSLLHTLEGQNGQVDSRYEETVRVSACENMEKFHQAGTWQDGKEYWVYYELSVIDYEEYVQKRKQDAISRGYEFWTKGNDALKAGNLITALEFWTHGLEAVQPVINEELPATHQGGRIDVACELYASVKNVFSGVTLTSDSATLTLRPFTPAQNPVGLSLTRQGTPLRQVPLQAEFIRGDGQLDESIRTDINGRAALSVGNVTASLPRQQIKVSINDASFHHLSGGVFGELVKQVLTSAPQVLIYINVMEESKRACICAENGADAAIVRAVKDLLSRNRFVMVDDPALADIRIAVSAQSRKGEKQRAGVSAMVAWYASVGITITKREGTVVLLEYVPEEIRVLQAESVPEATARRAAVNELIRRMNRQLPERMKDLYLGKADDR